MAEGLVVVARLGVVGSEPLGLYDELAEHFGADQYVPAKIHEEMFPDEPINDMSTEVRQLMLGLSAASLAAGRSVIYDAYVNKPRLREELMRAADRAGALAVLIHCKTPMRVMKQRVAERFRVDQLFESTVKDELRMVSEMFNYTQKPDINPHATGLLHCCVSGEAGVAQIIPQVDEYIASLRQQQNT